MLWDIYVVAIVSFASLHTVAHPSAKQVWNLGHEFPSPSTISARDGVLPPGPFYQPGMWVWPSSISSYPSCMANANTTDLPICQPIKNAMDTCSSYMCVAQYSMLGFVGCTRSATLINETCLCEYQLDSCYQESCGLIWQKHDYLTWLNGTCSSISTWHGLQSDWTQKLKALRSDIMPWAVNVTTVDSHLEPRFANCASAAAKLGAFAAVNLGMALLVPVLGRRDVIHRLSRGYLGKQDSMFWILTAIFSVCLHICSNGIAAYLVQQTPGYENTQVGKLVLLWCTRPRVAWMVVALIPFRAEESLYFSVAASTLLSELVLQLIAAKFMGGATNYARIQKFYTRPYLIDSSPYGHGARLMYAGSLMWLVFLFAALVCGLVTMVGITTIALARKAAAKEFQEKLSQKSKYCTNMYQYWLNMKGIGGGQEGAPCYCRGNRGWRSRKCDTCPQNTHRNFFIEREWELLISAWKEVSDRWSSMIAFTANSNGIEDVLPACGLFPPGGPVPHQKLSISDRGRVEAILELLKHYDRPQRHEYDESVAVVRPPVYRPFLWYLKEGSGKKYHSEALIVEDLLYAAGRYRVEYEKILTRLQEGECLEEQLQAQLLAPQPSPKSAGGVRRPWLGLIDSFQMGWQDIALECIELEGFESQSDDLIRAQNYSIGQLMAQKGEWYIAKLAWIPIVGMLGCWIAQWLWWVGYIHAAGDWYCLPKVSQIAAVWFFFSAFGAATGASF